MLPEFQLIFYNIYIVQAVFKSTDARPRLEFFLGWNCRPQQSVVHQLEGHQRGIIHNKSGRNVCNELGKWSFSDQTLVGCSICYQTTKSLTHQGYLVVDLQSGVNFTNFIPAAFAQADPKSGKRHWWLDCLFVLLG